MTEYHYTTYRIGNLTLPDDLVLTPQQQKAIVAKLQAALDRSMIEVLTGGYYVPALHESPKGTTIEHVRRPRALLPDSRQESREGSLGPHQSRARKRTSQN